MQFIAAHEVKGRDKTVDGIAQDTNLGRRLGKDFMKAKQHVTFEHASFLQALWRQPPQMGSGPSKENGID